MKKRSKKTNSSREVDDGYGAVMMCVRIDCDLQVVRPGKVQCRGEDDSLGCPHSVEELIATMKEYVDKVIERD